MKNIQKTISVLLYLFVPDKPGSDRFRMYEKKFVLSFLKVSIYIAAVLFLIKLLSLVMYKH